MRTFALDLNLETEKPGSAPWLLSGTSVLWGEKVGTIVESQQSLH